MGKLKIIKKQFSPKSIYLINFNFQNNLLRY